MATPLNDPNPFGFNGAPARYLLRLYVTGTTPLSARALANVKAICERRLHGRYRLEVIDLYQQPELAANAGIVAAPTLLKRLPLPVRRLIGDMSDEHRLVAGLDLEPDDHQPFAGGNGDV